MPIFSNLSTMDNSVKIGIIWWSGLDNPDLLKNAEDISVTTKYGDPSSPLKIWKIWNVDVVLLARHGRDHTIPPTYVNYKANIMALKEIWCTHIIATTAVGSLREHIQRWDLVFPDQFIDFTRRRDVSFCDAFASHCPVHTPMSEPFSKSLRNILIESAKLLNITHHEIWTVVTIEWARFSTRAESNMFRLRGADIINMSIAPEAILANEAWLPYATIAMSTDYDCRKVDEEPVTWEWIIEIFKQNVDKVIQLLLYSIPKIQ